MQKLLRKIKKYPLCDWLCVIVKKKEVNVICSSTAILENMSKLTRGKTKEIQQSPKQTMIKADIVEKVKIFMPLIKYLSSVYVIT